APPRLRQRHRQLAGGLPRGLVRGPRLARPRRGPCPAARGGGMDPRPGLHRAGLRCPARQHRQPCRAPRLRLRRNRTGGVLPQAGGLMGPRRIVCLTEEPTEALYALGEQDRIVGISGFTVRPPRARREKPKVRAFTSAKVEAILALRPDLAIGFSDIQADIAAGLVRRGVEVWIANRRSVDGILDYIRGLGALVGVAAKADAWAGELQRGLDAARERAQQRGVRPRVYFEEWD